jgi:hypothetical protein
MVTMNKYVKNIRSVSCLISVVLTSGSILTSCHGSAACIVKGRISTVLHVTGLEVSSVELLRHSLVVDYLELGVLLSLMHLIEVTLKKIWSGRRPDAQSHFQELVSSSCLHILLVE